MLDILRKRKRSWIVIFFLFLIVVVFVLFYGGQKMREPGAEKVAEVNGEAITQSEFGTQYQRLVEVYRNLLKKDLTPETLKNLKLKKTVLDELIDKRLLLQETRRLGLQVTDEELTNVIGRAPEFQIEGRFSKNRYLQVLSASRIAPGQFEDEQRERILVQKLHDVMQDAVHVSENEVRERYSFAQEKVSLHFIRLSAGDFLSQASAPEEEIKKYYDRNKAALTEPLKVQIEYVGYPFDQFSTKVRPSDKEIEDYYNLHRETQFHQQKTLKLRHILLRLPAGADAGQKAGARSKADAVVQAARAGKDFTELAKQYSEDPSSARGGDVGWINQSQLIQPLDQAVFALKRGEVSGALESPVGYHIFKVEDAKEEKKTGLKEATPEIVRTLKTDRGKGEAARAADQDREKAVSGTDLSLLAKPRGLAAKMTPMFGASDTFPEMTEDFKKTALSLAVKEVGQVVEGPNGYYLLRAAQRKEPTLPPLESLRAEVERKVRQAKALELANKKAQALLDLLKKENDIGKVAKANGLQVGETGWFLRSDAEIPKVGVLQDSKPGGVAVSAHQPVADRPYAENNSVYVFEFKASQGADMERFEKNKTQLLEQALAEKKQAMAKKFVESLKAKAQVKVEPSFLEES
jgi:peptidyl-prolyl cis-trans isomerase D